MGVHQITNKPHAPRQGLRRELSRTHGPTSMLWRPLQAHPAGSEPANVLPLTACPPMAEDSPRMQRWFHPPRPEHAQLRWPLSAPAAGERLFVCERQTPAHNACQPTPRQGTVGRSPQAAMMAKETPQVASGENGRGGHRPQSASLSTGATALDSATTRVPTLRPQSAAPTIRPWARQQRQTSWLKSVGTTSATSPTSPELPESPQSPAGPVKVAVSPRLMVAPLYDECRVDQAAGYLNPRATASPVCGQPDSLLCSSMGHAMGAVDIASPRQRAAAAIARPVGLLEREDLSRTAEATQPTSAACPPRPSSAGYPPHLTPGPSSIHQHHHELSPRWRLQSQRRPTGGRVTTSECIRWPSARVYKPNSSC